MASAHFDRIQYPALAVRTSAPAAGESTQSRVKKDAVVPSQKRKLVHRRGPSTASRRGGNASRGASDPGGGAAAVAPLRLPSGPIGRRVKSELVALHVVPPAPGPIGRLHFFASVRVRSADSPTLLLHPLAPLGERTSSQIPPPLGEQRRLASRAATLFPTGGVHC